MIKRFLSYYKPHMRLFVIDMSAATVASLVAIFFPYLTRTLLKDYIPEKNLTLIVYTLSAMALIYLVTTGLNYIRIRWGHTLGVRMEADMRAELFRHVQKLSFTYFDNTKTGHIMSRISNDLNMIAEVAHHAPEDLLISLVVIIGAYTFMFMFSVPLALVSLIPFPFMVAWGIIFGRKMRSRFRQIRKRVADINSTVENSVQGIREVKAFANEAVEEKKFSHSNTGFQEAKERAYVAMAGFHSGMNFIVNMYYLVVVGGGVIFILNGTVQVYDLLSFVLFIGVILPPIERLINFTEQLQEGATAFERFTEIMDIEPDIQDVPGAEELVYNRGNIEFKSVSFKYEKSPNWVLKNISLTVPFGKKIALVGQSGAGKSSLISLIPRFYEPQKGSIAINGIEVHRTTQTSLRKQIGIVQQNVFLFDATIRENMIYGSPDATDNELVEAAKKANIYEFIMTLPDGFDTPVGERGVKLSGGQKQRVAIARVFLKNPPILILDEATSSLDNESEALIQEAMERLSEDRTTIIIAHRLSTVQHVDTIYVMKEGEVVEEGSHEKLLSAEGYYAQLYRRTRF